MKKKFQIIPVTVTSANQTVAFDTETDIRHESVNGVFVTISNQSAKANLRLHINSEEILPRDFESALIKPEPYIPFKDVVWAFDEKAKGSKVKVEIRDISNGATYPYVMNIYLLTIENR